MPKGKSGRVVIEVDPALKRRLYSELAREDLTLKDWFVDAVSQYLSETEQPSLPGVFVKKSRETRAP